MNESTKQYIEDNEIVQNLPRRVAISNKQKTYRIHSLSWLISKRIKLFRELAKFFLEIFLGFRLLIRTFKRRRCKGDKKALVLGNGPSQGYLSKVDLQRFKKAGVEIFGVNYINQNKIFSDIPPDYLVLSDSGTLNFSPENHALFEKNQALLDYLHKNKDIKIICAALRLKNLKKVVGENRIIGAFIDSEFTGVSNNISPMFPRGYCSMTLYKCLAYALWCGYKNVFILGMDNTYPRNIYCDERNAILALEIHAETASTVTDMSQSYGSMGDFLVGISIIFHDAQKFTHKSIINLDPYSLTDAFKKNSTRDISKFIDEL